MNNTDEKELSYGCWVNSDHTIFNIDMYRKYKKQNQGCANCAHCSFCGDKLQDLWVCDCREKANGDEIFPIENGEHTADYNYCDGEFYEPISRKHNKVSGER